MRTRVVLAAVSLVLGVACAKTLDAAGLQDQIRSLLQERGGPTVTDVTCPEDVKAEQGATFECSATGEHTTWTILVTQRDDHGTMDMKIVNASEGGA